MKWRRSLCCVLLCVCLLFGLFSTSHYAAAATADDDAVISLSAPSKIFNDDGTVTVTYDLPLSPYSVIYGQPINSTEFVQVGTSTNIYFTQDKDESITVFTALSNGSVSSTTSGSSGNGCVWTSAHMEPSVFDVDAVTHLIVNGVAYPVQPYSNANYYMFYDTNPDAGSEWTGRYSLYTVFGPNTPSADWGWSFMSQTRIDATLAVGYYEDVMISQHEYDYIYPVLSPFGITEDGRYNCIDISDIRTGGTFDVSVTYDYNIALTGTDTTTTFMQYVDFYDEDFNLLSTSFYTTEGFDVANGASMTIDTKLTVPNGACYMDMEISTDPFAVSDVQLLDWRVSDMQMTFDMSDVEANSLMMSGIIDRLDTLVDEALETNESLDEIIALLKQIIADMSSSGCDHTEIVELLERITGKQDQELTWLEKIWQAVTSIPDQIGDKMTDLFVPSEEKIQEVTDKADQLVHENLGGVAQAGDAVMDIAGAFVEQETQEFITFPAVTLEFSGVPWTFGGWQVDVVPDGFEWLFGTLAYIIDIVATLAFVNSMKRRWERVMEG